MTRSRSWRRSCSSGRRSRSRRDGSRPPSRDRHARRAHDRTRGDRARRSLLARRRRRAGSPAVEPRRVGQDVPRRAEAARPARITRVFVPMVFDRWKGLESFDICQEPVNDPRDEPPPVTQIYVNRSALDRVGSWKKATLPDLLAASPKDRRQRGADYYVYFDNDVLQDPKFQKAADAVGYDTYRVVG